MITPCVNEDAVGQSRSTVGLGMRMEKVRAGKYKYKGFEVTNHGYYAPEKCVWWEAVNPETGCADYHAHTKSEIKRMIDKDTPNMSDEYCKGCGIHKTSCYCMECWLANKAGEYRMIGLSEIDAKNKAMEDWHTYQSPNVELTGGALLRVPLQRRVGHQKG